MNGALQDSRQFGSRQYRAFLSYSHADKVAADWLHGALERFRVPAGVTSSHRFVRPVFRDDVELAATADLGPVIRTALLNSEALVVLCSPDAARSRWVNEEITEFKRLGRQDRIFAVVAAGEPGPGGRNCFPAALTVAVNQEGMSQNPAVEPLAIDLTTHGKRDTVLKVAAAILDVPFDTLKRRDRIRRTKRTAAIATAAFLVLAAYTASLIAQTRAVNRQLSAILATAARDNSEHGENARALRFGVMAARTGPLSPSAEIAEPLLIRAAHFSTLQCMLPQHGAAIYSLIFDPSGRRLLTGSQDRTARLWSWVDSKGWQQDGSEINTEQVYLVRWVERGEAVAILTLDGEEIKVWRRSDGSWKASMPFSKDHARIRWFDTAAEGNVISIAREDNSLKIWRFDGGSGQWHEAATLSTGGRLPVVSTLSIHGDRLIASYDRGGIDIFESDGSGTWRKADPINSEDLEYGAEFAAFSDSSDRLAVTWLGAGVRIFDRATDGRWHQAGSFSSDRLTSRAVFDAANKHVIVTNGKDVAARILSEGQSGIWTTAAEFRGESDFTRTISTAPGGLIATGGNDGYARIWSPGDMGSWRAYFKVRSNIGLVRDVDTWTQGHTGFREPHAKSADNRRVAVGDVYGVVRLTDTTTGIEVAAYDASDSPQYALRFANGDRVLEVLDPQSQSVVRKLDTEVAVALHGPALVNRVCALHMRKPLSVVTDADIAAMPAIRGHLGLDVAENKDWLGGLVGKSSPTQGSAR